MLLLVFINLFLLVLSQAQHASKNEDPYHCIMYDTSPRSNNRPFVYNGPPKLLKDPQGLAILKRYAPNLYKGPNSTYTCCSPYQLNVLFSSSRLLIGSLFKYCPTCEYNINQPFFYMNCAPDQSRFQKLLASAYDRNVKKMGVTAIDYYISKTSVLNIIRSCRSVHHGATGLALTSMCGRSADKCTPKAMFDFASKHAPYKFNSIFSDYPVVQNGTTYIPLETDWYACSAKIDGKSCKPAECINTQPLTRPATTVTAATERTTVPSISKSVKLHTTKSTPVHKVKHKHLNWFEKTDTAERVAGGIFIGGVIICVVFLVVSLKFNSPKVKTQRVKILQKDEKIRFSIQNTASMPEKITAASEHQLRKWFCKWGMIAARHPYVVIASSIAICIGLSCGLLKFQVTTDPVKLWAAPESKSRIDRDYFDQHFGPFYRTEQIIIKPKDQSNFVHEINGANVTFGPAFRQKFLIEVLKLQDRVQDLSTTFEGENITLQDVCFRPLYPEYDDCTIQTALNYFQNNMTRLSQSDHLLKLKNCLAGYVSRTECFGTYGGPIQPEVVLGAFPKSKPELAKALVITFVNDNSLDKNKVDKAKAWELQYINFLKNFKSDHFTFAFNSERSIEDELNKSSRGDVFTILISYTVMFTYITLALGQPRSISTILVDSKMSLGLAGVTIVVVSVISSIGFFSFVGVPATLIIIEVIPFLVLAVGVDNIFILVQALQRDKRRNKESIESQIGRVVGEVGPSMLLSSVSEACCFFLGTLSDMPAVKIFAMYAGFALLVDFLLQITCFVSLLTLDAKRQEDNRWDVACCVKSETYAFSVSESFLYKFFRNYYAPFLMNHFVRTVIMVLFLGWLCSSVAVIDKLEVGLDQELALPKDSYVVNYFSNLKKYLSIGPPVYFVITNGYKYDTYKGQSRLCYIPTGCNNDSFSQKIMTAVRHSENSTLQGTYYSWIDNYISFMSDEFCCSAFKANSTICPTSVGMKMSGGIPQWTNQCASCSNNPITYRPIGNDFHEYLPFFKNRQPTEYCAEGGQANYKYYIESKTEEIKVNKTKMKAEQPEATMFMLYHTVLKDSADYTRALYSARKLEDELTKYLHDTDDDPHPTYRVFAYSVFYVFYEQYLTTWPDTIRALGISVATVFCVILVLSGLHIHSSLIILATICMILVNLLGVMYWWSIALNAVALVNLIMAVGISVEFCSHITRAFSSSVQFSRIERAEESLTNMGSSVLSGITLTKFGGIVVLAFAKSRIFQIYYFRLYLCIVLFGAAHGLILLPVILSIIGPSLNRQNLLNKTKTDREDDKQPQERYTMSSNF